MKNENETGTEEILTEDKFAEWKPKTSLGLKVKNGEIKSLSYILNGVYVIKEPQIVDFLLPGLEEEIILVGGTPGKGGGKKRIITKKTARMHRSGRRFTTRAMVIIGNRNGFVGIGEGAAQDTREAISKAVNHAKLNIIQIRRGCGSWECGCKTAHSIPFKVEGVCGASAVVLMPAPKGIGLCVNDEVKKVMKLAGIEDVWMKTYGSTNSRENLIKATFDALRKLNKIKVMEKQRAMTGLKEGDM